MSYPPKGECTSHKTLRMEDHEKATQVYQTLLYRWALRYTSLRPVTMTIKDREEINLRAQIKPEIEDFDPSSEFRTECAWVGLEYKEAREWLFILFSRNKEIQTYREFLQVIKTSSWVQIVYLKKGGNWVRLLIAPEYQDYLDVIEYILVFAPDPSKVRLWVKGKELYVDDS